jgi:hypothetical protein
MAHPKLMLRGHFDVAVNWQNYLRVLTSVEELLVEAFFFALCGERRTYSREASFHFFG